MNPQVRIVMDEMLAFVMTKTINYLDAAMSPDEVRELTKSITDDPKLREIAARMVKIEE